METEGNPILTERINLVTDGKQSLLQIIPGEVNLVRVLAVESQSHKYSNNISKLTLAPIRLVAEAQKSLSTRERSFYSLGWSDLLFRVFYRQSSAHHGNFFGTAVLISDFLGLSIPLFKDVWVIEALQAPTLGYS